MKDYWGLGLGRLRRAPARTAARTARPVGLPRLRRCHSGESQLHTSSAGVASPAAHRAGLAGAPPPPNCPRLPPRFPPHRTPVRAASVCCQRLCESMQRHASFAIHQGNATTSCLTRSQPPSACSLPRLRRMTTADELGQLRARLDKCGQQHLMEGYEALAPEQQAELLGQLKVGSRAGRAGGAMHAGQHVVTGCLMLTGVRRCSCVTFKQSNHCCCPLSWHSLHKRGPVRWPPLHRSCLS